MSVTESDFHFTVRFFQNNYECDELIFGTDFDNEADISPTFSNNCITWLSFDCISRLIFYWLEAKMLFIDKNFTVTLHIFSLSSFHEQLSGKHIYFS